MISDLWGVLEAAGISQQRVLELATQNGSITRALGWGENAAEEGGPTAEVAPKDPTRVMWGDPALSPTKRGSKHSLPSALLRLTGKATAAQHEWVRRRTTAVEPFTALQEGEETTTERACTALVEAADHADPSLMSFTPNPLLSAKTKHNQAHAAKRHSGPLGGAGPRAGAGVGGGGARAVNKAEAEAAALEPETGDEEGYGATSASDSELTPQQNRNAPSAGASPLPDAQTALSPAGMMRARMVSESTHNG